MNELSFIPFPVLLTERLSLQRIKLEDEKDLFALRSNEHINAFLDRPSAKSVAAARQFIHQVNDAIADNKSINWAIVLNETGKLIGTICLWQFVKADSKAEIGYELLPSHQGKGLMQEAIAAVVEYGFKIIELEVIEAEVHVENVKSIQLLEKNGFVKVINNKEDSTDNHNKVVIYKRMNHEYNTIPSR